MVTLALSVKVYQLTLFRQKENGAPKGAVFDLLP